ncbi:hypothetical protein CGLO_01674 [Colletotrichum gloeosporioides Cg-14]|uniref:Uncharacterized protein n=1 Tax=Colletotrichum gloeosporioides (strain Cg-14) TaxID=1237896 RepID=T0L0Z1_COLGC|nr:hypothetical protein CGLO_01674 [Colletotrichum gloeosporioides Cg-14]
MHEFFYPTCLFPYAYTFLNE